MKTNEDESDNQLYYKEFAQFSANL